VIEQGDVVRLPGTDRFVKVKGVNAGGPPFLLFVEGDDPSEIRQVTLDHGQILQVERLTPDGSAKSSDVLAALWSEWMGSAASNTTGAAMISSQLTPYPHQHQAVYQRMLPQPMLRFLLGDEPGTGKTIMGGCMPARRSVLELSAGALWFVRLTLSQSGRPTSNGSSVADCAVSTMTR
jgi:hypothetical protein